MAQFLKYLFNSILLAVAVISAAWLVLWKTQDAKVYSVQTTSMQPTLSRGDLLIDLKPELPSLIPGHLVSYDSPQQPGEVVTHRLVSVDSYHRVFVAKGDNLKVADPPASFDKITGKAFKAVPKAGYFLNAVRKPLGLILLVYIPGLLIAFGELWLLAGKLRPGQDYSLSKSSKTG